MSTEQQKGQFNYFIMVVVAVVLFIALISVLVVNSSKQDTAANSERDMSAAEENTKPFGNVEVASTGAATDAATSSPSVINSDAATSGGDPGKATYDKVCTICHTPGAAGAPKLGDSEAWVARIEQGIDTLTDHAVSGFAGNTGIMPPKGGMTDLTDENVAAAVVYMVNNSGGSVDVTAAPAAGGSDALGQKTYDTVCTACHSAAIANAIKSPAFSDVAAWAPRIAKGKEVLYTSALNGLNAMPPKGGMANLSDDAVKAAVDYMVNAAQ